MIHYINTFLSIEVKFDEQADCYRVYVHKSLNVEKVRELSHTYSTEWNEQSIIKDVIKYYQG